MDKKIKIIIATIIVIVIGFTGFKMLQLEVFAPQSILRGNIILTNLLPLDLKEGYMAIYDIFYDDEKVGNVTWNRIEQNKIKAIQLINIPELYFEESTTIIIHCPDSLRPKEVIRKGNFKAKGISYFMKINIVVDYELNEIVTTMKVDENIFPSITDIITLDTVAKINIQDLYVGWEIANIKVVRLDTVTIPAGTFDVLVIEHTGYHMMQKIKVTYYATLCGKIIKLSYFPPGFDLPLISKLRSYLPK